MTRELKIKCLGIGDISMYISAMAVTLQNVDMSFLEDLSSRTIVNNHNTEALLKAMDYDDICEYLESTFNVKITKE